MVFGLAKIFTLNYTCMKENLNYLFHRELRRNNLFRVVFSSKLLDERLLVFEYRSCSLPDYSSDVNCNSEVKNSLDANEQQKIIWFWLLANNA